MPHTYYAYTRPNFYWRRQNEHINAFYTWFEFSLLFTLNETDRLASPLHGNRNFGHHIKWIRTLRNGRIVFDYWCVTEFVLNMLGCAACLAKNLLDYRFLHERCVWIMRARTPIDFARMHGIWMWTIEKPTNFSEIEWNVLVLRCVCRAKNLLAFPVEKSQFQNDQCQTRKWRVYGDRK